MQKCVNPNTMILKLHDEGDAVKEVQQMLNFLGFRYRKGNRYKPLVEDGKFGPKTESVVIDFQRSQGLLRDGIVGPITFAHLEKEYSIRVLELTAPGVDPGSGFEGQYFLKVVYADPYDQSYTRVSLRQDVAKVYEKIRAKVLSHGGILPSSGTIRSLWAQVTSSRSATSFHYLGRAFDLFVYGGMVEPEKDPFVIVKDEADPRYFRVYARCKEDWPVNEADMPSTIELPPKRELKNIYTYADRTGKRNKPVTDHFLDLTSLFTQHGFERIAPRRSFFDHGSMMGAEWWHFQYEEGLIPEVSTFGGELKKLYTKKTLKKSKPWKYRHFVFGKEWN